MNVLFRRNLGFIFDATQIVTCKTARRESWIDTFVRNGNESKDLQAIENILEKFDDLNPKLLLIGYRERKRESLLDCMFIDYADDHIGNWDAESFLNYITDVDRFTSAAANYYFGHSSSDNIFEEIGEAEHLSSALKSILYDFFLFPDKYMALVKNELSRLFLTLEKYHNDNLECIVSCQEAFNYELLDSKNIPFAKKKKWDKGLSTCYVSFSLVSKYVIERNKVEDLGWVILGYDYAKAFEEPNETKLDIAAFGNAFGDKIRVRIVELIVQNGEMTLADLSKEIGVVNTIAIYHLDILKKENLLLHRYQGRKVLYCLNTSQINKGLDAVRALCGMDEE